jgi:hypothetical protein
MSRDGAPHLKHYPADIVRLACTRCPRKGQYRKAALAVKFGKEVSLPTMRALIAKCEHEGKLGRLLRSLLCGFKAERVASLP